MYTPKTRLKVYFYGAGIRLDEVAALLGISAGALRSKINGETDFKCHEVDVLLEAYPDLNDSYFLGSSVARTITDTATK